MRLVLKIPPSKNYTLSILWRGSIYPFFQTILLSSSVKPLQLWILCSQTRPPTTFCCHSPFPSITPFIPWILSSWLTVLLCSTRSVLITGDSGIYCWPFQYPVHAFPWFSRLWWAWSLCHSTSLSYGLTPDPRPCHYQSLKPLKISAFKHSILQVRIRHGGGGGTVNRGLGSLPTVILVPACPIPWPFLTLSDSLG